MTKPSNDNQEPKFVAGPAVVWVSVGLAVLWAAVLLYVGYGPGARV